MTIGCGVHLNGDGCVGGRIKDTRENRGQSEDSDCEAEADEARERYLAERAERTGESVATESEEEDVEATDAVGEEEAPAAGVDEELIRRLEEFRRERLGE